MGKVGRFFTKASTVLCLIGLGMCITDVFMYLSEGLVEYWPFKVIWVVLIMAAICSAIGWPCLIIDTRRNRKLIRYQGVLKS